MRSRIIAIDFGLKRIGVAISDESKIIATPFKTLFTEKKGEDTAKKLINELKADALSRKYTIEKIIVGMPFMMNGKMGFLADEVTHFIEMLKNLIDCPILPWDERLTTAQAEKSLLESELTRRRRSQIVDSIAAIIILQSYLDHISFQKSQDSIT